MTGRETELYLDRTHLATKAYGDSVNLQARADIYAYQEPKVDLQSWVLGHVVWRGDEHVLDVGCGPGSYLKRLAQQSSLQLSAVDLSHGMLVDLAGAWPSDQALPGRIVADAQALPLRSASQDVVLATHMLYHVPHIVEAVREIRRVLRPGGAFLAVTNAEEHTLELYELYAAALKAANVNEPERPKASHRFARKNGAELLRVAFADVVRHDQNSAMRIPIAEPVLRYLNSTRASREPMLPTGTTWDDVIVEAERIIETTIEREGVFHVRTAVSLFVCQYPNTLAVAHRLQP